MFTSRLASLQRTLHGEAVAKLMQAIAEGVAALVEEWRHKEQPVEDVSKGNLLSETCLSQMLVSHAGSLSQFSCTCCSCEASLFAWCGAHQCTLNRPLGCL